MRRTLKTISLTGVLALGVVLAAGTSPARAQMFGLSTPGFSMTIGGPGYYGGYYGGYPGYYGYGVPYGGYYGAGYGVPYYGSYYGVYPGIGFSSYRTYGYGYRPYGYGFRHRGFYGGHYGMFR